MIQTKHQIDRVHIVIIFHNRGLDKKSINELVELRNSHLVAEICDQHGLQETD